MSTTSNPTIESEAAAGSPSASMVNEPSDSLFKTAMCRTFASTSTCPYGIRCLFAHGNEELRSVNENQLLLDQGMSPKSREGTQFLFSLRMNQVAARLGSISLPTSTTTATAGSFFPSSPQWATMYQQSTPSQASPVSSYMCSPSPTSAARWSQLSLSPLSNSSPISSSSPAVGSRRGSSIDPQRQAKLFKTELCRTFDETGSCPYGNRCQFAHGGAELRPVERHQKYKTEHCQKFHTEGVCPFGSRCVFIHDEDVRELPNHPDYDPEFAAQQARERRASSRKSSQLYQRSPVAGAAAAGSRFQRMGSFSNPRRSAAGPSSTDAFLLRRMSDLTLDRGTEPKKSTSEVFDSKVSDKAQASVDSKHITAAVQQQQQHRPVETIIQPQPSS